MTAARTPGAVPPGMPAHLWEAAKRDVRGVIPDWLRSAKENGADAPAHIREVARRAAKAGAGLGMAIAVGSQVDAAATTDGATVATVAHTTPDVPTVPGDAPPLAESFRVLDPQGVGDGWLAVEMYQDVVVNEGADAAYNVDAFQYLVITDDAGQRYVFKEHHHAAVSEPPARETDLLIHERGQVHVVENPDGSFSVDTVSYDRSVNGVSDPAPDSGLDDEPDDVPVPEGWTPPAGFATVPAPTSAPEDEVPADPRADLPPPDGALDGLGAPDALDALDPTPGSGEPAEILHEPTAAATGPPDDDGPGNDPPDAGELAV